MSETPESKPQKWPFDIWLRLSVLHMNISPQDFWDMSVRDWFVLCRRNMPAQFSKDNLTDLMQLFPDATEAKPAPEFTSEKKDN